MTKISFGMALPSLAPKDDAGKPLPTTDVKINARGPFGAGGRKMLGNRTVPLYAGPGV
ncbi:hypothetical protein [Roseixanthobacter pseudopolyaromaticivorans]|uniref:hypothetical protein n=1 Tax=Xanthobacteraceae TaxID=335928 RepID=UPI003729EDAF